MQLLTTVVMPFSALQNCGKKDFIKILKGPIVSAAPQADQKIKAKKVVDDSFPTFVFNFILDICGI